MYLLVMRVNWTARFSNMGQSVVYLLWKVKACCRIPSPSYGKFLIRHGQNRLQKPGLSKTKLSTTKIQFIKFPAHLSPQWLRLPKIAFVQLN